MKGLERLAVKFGAQPVVILTIVLSCVAVVAGFFWQYQQGNSQYQNLQTQSQQRTSKLIVSAVSARAQALMQQVAAAAKSSDLARALANQDAAEIKAQQAVLSSLYPNAYKVCLIAADVDQPDPNACLPITFATLNGLRQAKKKGSAAMGVLGLGTADAYLLLANRIVDENEKIVGVLLVALAPDVVQQLLLSEFGADGYVELQQGNKQVAKVSSTGNAQWKQGKAGIIHAIPNSHWQVAYWPETKETPSLPIILMASLLIILTGLWFLRETWQRLLLKQDIKTLRRQLKDFQKSTLRPKYPTTDVLLQDVVDDIQTMGREGIKSKKGVVKKLTTKDVSAGGSNIEQSPENVVPAISHVDASIFKAYDIRGIVGETINEQAFIVLGRAIGSEAQAQQQSRLVVARDGRLSSDSLAKALIEGILASGCSVLDIGKVPTPLMYFACETLGTHSGVMVTGSHNPANYNGLKTVLTGKPLAGSDVQALYRRIEKDDFAKGKGALSKANVVDDYIKRIVDDVHTTRSIKVVVDCGNGIAGVIAPRLLREFGCEVIELYCDVDGNFPNHHPNPSEEHNLEDLAAEVKKHEAELGIAFDGDGDRIGIVDATGQPIWPDRLMILFAQDVLSREPEATIIYDVKSSNLLGEAISRAGGNAVISPSGYSIIRQKIQETGAKLAGELSGHIFFNDRWFGFDDGLYAACRLLEFLSHDPLERTPSEVFDALPHRVCTPEILLEMNESESRRFVEQLRTEADFPGGEIITIDGLRVEFPIGWGLVRASNTMPGLTLRFEANTHEQLAQIKQQFKQQMLQIKPSLTLSF
jgi:phosphomannomutase / phosphoglucomutase